MYCLFKDPNQPVDRSVRNKIAVVLGGFVLCSSLMLACLRQPLRSQEKVSKNSTICSEMKKSLKLLVSKNILLSSIIFMFCGEYTYAYLWEYLNRFLFTCTYLILRFKFQLFWKYIKTTSTNGFRSKFMFPECFTCKFRILKIFIH